jgi:hypothetical protein
MITKPKEIDPKTEINKGRTAKGQNKKGRGNCRWLIRMRGHEFDWCRFTKLPLPPINKCINYGVMIGVSE